MRTRLTSSSHPVPSRPDEECSVKHRSVLLHEAVHMLAIHENDIVLDATLGGGGHAQELVKGLGGNGLFIGFDADQDAVERARNALADSRAPTRLVCEDFRHMERELRTLGIPFITKALFDLGWSSYQLDSGRGFSFNADEPLLMTYRKDAEGMLTAATIVNTWGEGSIADVLFGFGGERYSRRIARRIVEERERTTFATSKELADVVVSAYPSHARRGRIHPATRTFQALRIAVNDELGALTEGLAAAWKLLAPGGRLAVISFHSTEDRIVKRMFAEKVRAGEGRLVEKKPVVPGGEETRENPRARSAKLRVVEKISHESTHTKNKQVRPLHFSGEA